MASYEIHRTSIAGLCCSGEGVLFILDAGRSLVYLLDLKAKECKSFGAGYLESPVDITFFGIFLVVLNKNGIALFDPEGLLLKRFYFKFNSRPKAVCIADSTIIVIGENAEICKLEIEND